LGSVRSDISFDWIAFPAGEFWMGSDPHWAAAPQPDELPLHRVDLPAYRLSRTPVTNAHYAAFVADTGHEPPGHWAGRCPPSQIADAPVTYVSWQDAHAFCAWAGGRLPTEAEWEKAARGPSLESRSDHAAPALWPWGDDLPGSEHAHFDEQRRGIPPGMQGPHPVGEKPAGAGPWGHLDLAGNVWEWTSSRYEPYPWTDDRDAGPGVMDRVTVRGGTYNHDLRGIRSAARTPVYPAARDVYIGFRLACAADSTPTPGIDMIDVPAGPFWMGSAPLEKAAPVFPDELPRHAVTLPPFEVARFLVTNAEYRQFVLSTGHPAPAHWPAGAIPAGLERHPVTWVDCRDASAFCDWAGVRLPTEAEWERAAAGLDARLYAWGDDQPDATRLNLAGSGTSPVGAFPSGATPDGIMDMTGNVWEWVQSRYAPYPYRTGDGRDDREPPGRRVLRGGSFLTHDPGLLRTAARSLSYETRRREHIGFRVARTRGE
jgi:formylglycine-generating enzyme required for sulfatase activity